MGEIERDFSFVYKDYDGNKVELLPKTVGSQVLLSNGYTAKDHVNDDRHLLESEKDRLVKTNLPSGYVTLGKDGYIPTEFIDKSFTSIRQEYNTIADMLADSKISYGVLVMVLDASADPRVTNSWAVYRRNKDVDEYWDLEKGWSLIYCSEVIDIDMSWQSVPGKPNSAVADIDDTITKVHTHNNKSTIDKIGEEDEHATFDGKKIAFEREAVKFFLTDYADDNVIRPGDFWLEPSFNQSWWQNDSVEYGGTSLYEKYRENDIMISSPKLRTDDVTTVVRMFYRCYALTDVQQYDYRKCEDFTGQFTECTSLKTVPCMFTVSGKIFDYQFKKCSLLEYSPRMILDEATRVVGMYSGCTMMKRVLSFGSTAKISNMKEWFNGCSALQIITDPIDFTSIEDETAVENMFNECVDLEVLSFVPNTLKVSLSLAGTNLSIECIDAIIEGLPTVEGKTLNLTNIPNVEYADSALIQEATAKGWTILRE